LIEDSYKAIWIGGAFSDMQHLIEVAGQQAKQIFHTNEKIKIVYSHHVDYPSGWMVLVARPRLVDQRTPLVGRGGVRT
jgi:hypothetical protein